METGPAAVSHGVGSDSLMSRPSLRELWLGAGTNMKTMPPVDGIWSFAGTSCEALYRGIHFNITSTEEFISISPVQSKCITLGRGKKEERNLGCTCCFPAACSNPHHPFTKNPKMQMNVAETTPAFQEHIDGILEQHIGPGKSNATLHFHLLVYSQKCHPLVIPYTKS